MEINKMNNKNNVNTNRKKIVTSLALGGLILGGSFAAFAASPMSNNGYGQEFGIQSQINDNLVQQDKLDLLADALELQIEHANILISELDDDSANIDELKSIVDEFAQLEKSLDELNVDGLMRDELREIFFEVKSESKELSQNFKDLIEDSFTEEERLAFREEFRTQREQVLGGVGKYGGSGEGLGNYGEGNFQSNQFNSLNRDEIETVRKEMGWNRGQRINR
jgi:hypothetical protein